MDGAIVDKIIANFEGKPFDEKNGTEPRLMTKQNVPNPEGLQVLSTDLYGPMGQSFPGPSGGSCGQCERRETPTSTGYRATATKCPSSVALRVILWQV